MDVIGKIQESGKEIKQKQLKFTRLRTWRLKTNPGHSIQSDIGPVPRIVQLPKAADL